MQGQIIMVPVIKCRARTQKRTRWSNGFATEAHKTPAMSGKVLGKEECLGQPDGVGRRAGKEEQEGV